MRQARDAVRFADDVQRLVDEGVGLFVDVSPDGVLTSMIAATAPDATVVPTLRAGHLVHTAAELFTAGVELDWAAVLGAGAAVELPTYAFQHERYWPVLLPPPAANREADGPFWDLVERGDAAEFADTLDVDESATADEILPALARWRGREQAAGWRYEVRWEPFSPVSAVTGRWSVLTGPGVPAGLAETVAAGLAARGAEVTLDTDLPAAAEHVLSLLTCAPGSPEAFDATVRLVQACAERGPTGRLWCVTQGLDADPWTSQIWGLGRVAALEYPALWGGLIDLPPAVDDEILEDKTLDQLAAVLADGTEDQVAVRAVGARAARLTRMRPTAAARHRPSRGTVLVTGASGALGERVARWVANDGAERVVLASRQGDGAANAGRLAAELAAAGAEAVFARCDIADPEQVRALVDLAGDGLSAVFHLAGVGEQTPIAGADPRDWAGPMAAKVTGARLLDRVLGDRPLDAFVLFSSIAGVWGSGGQAAYAAANAFLDGLAADRRRRGLAGTAIAWGPWQSGGMAGGATGEYLAKRGLRSLDPTAALAALGDLLDRDVTTAVVADVDWAVFAPAFTLGRPAPILTAVPEAAAALRAAAGPGPAEGDGGLAAKLAGLDEAGRRQALLELVRGRAAAVLGHASAGAVPAEQAFSELGFDSLTAIELRNGLARATGLSLPATAVFDHPNPAALAEFLHGRIGGGTRRQVVVQSAAVADEPMAIVGMACRYPGGVSTPDELWTLVADGVDGIGPVPPDRGWESWFTGGGHPEGGFVAGATEFDAAFFGISPREALAMDPQQRLVLEASWEALERAGLDPAALRGEPIGVFAGASSPDYAALAGANPEAMAGYVATGMAGSVLSGRVSYVLGLTGPALTVDTACSSSLVALHLAAQALRNGECTLALAGGVTVMATPAAFAEFARQGGLAGDGRCKSFAGAADGTTWGEGVGMLVVERLSDARRNGHRVWGLVRGSAVNQDGASNGLTAPNGPSQERVILQALANAGLSPSEVDVVEGHGTGTRLGDPIEAQALLATYGQDRQEPLWLGSVKSNIGHTQAAAGVAGVIKMVLAMRHATMPATLHVDEPSPEVDWSAGNVALLTEPRAWPNGRPRRAGVSSFGISGTNAHVIIEEGDPAPGPADPAADAPTAWIVSAKSPRALRAQAARLADWAERHPEHGINDTAIALATRRSRFSHRAAVTGSDVAQLVAGLRDLAVTGHGASGPVAVLFSGQGSQRVGMGSELYGALPVYTATLDEIRSYVDVDLGERIDETQFAQIGLFAVQVAVYRQLEAWGLRPQWLGGHSIGELTAAYLAGVWDLEGACRIVAARGRLMASAPAGGLMASVVASEEEIRPYLVEGRVGLAAVNGPTSVVVSGDADAVTALIEGRKAKLLKVSHAFHSHHLDGILDEFRAVVASVPANQPVIDVLGDVTDPEYWVRQARDAVRFGETVRRFTGEGVNVFVDVSPDGTMTSMVAANAAEATVVPTLRPGNRLMSAAGGLHAAGVEVDWAAVLGAERTPVELPTYAFDHERFWFEAKPVADTSAGRRYEVRWEPVEPAAPAGALTGRWSVVTGPWVPDGLAELVAAGLAARGAQVTVDRERPASWDGHVISLLGCADGPDSPGLAANARLVRAAAEHGLTGRLWCATQGLDADPWTARTWGLGRVAALEHPALWGGLVDLPPTVDDTALDRLAAVLAGGEDQVMIGPDTTRAARLTRATEAPDTKEWTPGGTVLVTGASGAIGARVARWAAERGATRLILASRQGPDAAGADRLAADLAAAGAEAVFARCDMADPVQVRALVETAGAGLTAVFHAAGVATVEPLAETDPATWPSAMAAKVTGAWALDRALGDRPLDAFVVFSSIAGVWGSGGQAAYAAANAFLDGLAADRRRRGLAATAIAWGPWAGGGMADGPAGDYLARRGLAALDPGLALAELGRALDEDRTAVTVADVDWSVFAPAYTLGRPAPLLAAVPEAAAAVRAATGEAPATAEGPSLADRLAGLDAAEQRRRLLDIVRGRVAAVLGHASADGVPADQPFSDLGFDSLTALELRNALGRETGLALPATLVFDYPDPAAVAAHLHTAVMPPERSPRELALDGLDRLEAALAALAGDDAARGLVVTRLQALLAGPSNGHGAVPGSVPAAGAPPAGAAEHLAAASTSEIFDFIDKQLGRSK
ncbi:type I polyketide synthase [Dactylosporangium sucinum]|uniref:Uncharacterized protein n=1 Tax=Dactylosporangium sucinum TaxID=1424081 RepID=A0A917UG52_9ACTN|nr:type I polyketide synthase [Dactylosporangium sucinum]GGM90423.1 hypothetical protein GCM10007977_110560 [Dactylosporangium sucinum]